MVETTMFKTARAVCAWFVFTICATQVCAQAPANDFCSGAIEIPHDPLGSGFGAPGGTLLLGDTSSATVDIGSPGGCDVVPEPNIAPGVWFKLTGMGNLVRLSTDVPETLLNTVISVYCSDDLVDPCANLACLTANDDIIPYSNVFPSELEFCAQLGKEYFVLVHGSRSSSLGLFGLAIEEVRDGTNQVIPCVEVQGCSFECRVFEIPMGALDELTDFGTLSEACDETNIDGNNNGCDGPPMPNGSWRDRFPKIQVGDVVTGTLWTGGGFRDVDNFMFEGMPTDGNPALIDFSWQAESPIEIRVEHFRSDWFRCFGRTSALQVRSTAYCGDGSRIRGIYNFSGMDFNGLQPNDPAFVGSVNFEIRSAVSVSNGGLPCGVRNRYWLRLDEVVFSTDCPPVPDPPGVPTVDNPANPLMGDVTFGDWDTADIQPSFDGSCGSSCSLGGDPFGQIPDHFAGEPCIFFSSKTGFPGCFGLDFNNTFDGDFMLLRANVPTVSWIANCFSCAGAFFGDSTDWYRISIPTRSIVTLEIDSSAPFVAILSPGACPSFGQSFDQLGIGATLGRCGMRNSAIVDHFLLDAGVYMVRVQSYDAFTNSGPNSLSFDVFCIPDGFTKYVLEVSTAIAPQCAGDADGSGTVNFGDITSVLGAWLSDYSTTGGTGVGDGNGDGIVNFGDITNALSNWGVVCP